MGATTSDMQINRTPFIVVGVIGFLICVIQISLGFAIWTYFTNLKIGSWWISFPGFITFILCFFTNSKPVAVAVGVFATIGYLMGVVGCIVDGLAGAIIGSLTICEGGNDYSPSASSVSSTTAIDILACVIQNPNNDIICTDNTNCYFYNGAGTNPSVVQGPYLSLVRACTAFDVLATVIIFVTAVIAYSACCCPQCLGSVPGDSKATVHVQGVRVEPLPVVTSGPGFGKVTPESV